MRIYLLAIAILICTESDAQIIRAEPFYTAPEVVSGNLLLDDYPGAAVAYSLRKLDKDYTGSAIRVRRSSDNTEQDIGFVNNYLDTAAMKTFVGANNGFVVTWYNQADSSGVFGVRNATKSTAANQPQIIVSGAINYNDGDVVLDFDGTNDAFAIYDFQQSAYTNISTFCVASFDTTAGTQVLFGKYTTSTANRSFLVGQVGGVWLTNMSSDGSSATVANIQSTSSNPSGTNLFTAIHAAAAAQVINKVDFWRNASLANKTVVSTGSGTSIYDAPVIFEIGCTNNNLASFYNGKIRELIFYESGESSNRTAIESNINSFYSIY